MIQGVLATLSLTSVYQSPADGSASSAAEAKPSAVISLSLRNRTDVPVLHLRVPVAEGVLCSTYTACILCGSLLAPECLVRRIETDSVNFEMVMVYEHNHIPSVEAYPDHVRFY